MRSRTTRWALAFAAVFTPLAFILSMAAPAGAASPACTADLNGVNCQTLTDHHSPGPHALQAVAGVPGSRLVANPVSTLTVNQDFTVHAAAHPAGSYVIKFAPNDVQGSLCLEGFGWGTHAVLDTCNGATTQRWFIDYATGGGYNLTNALTGFALTHVLNHGVQMRSITTGTAPGKRWDVHFPA